MNKKYVEIAGNIIEKNLKIKTHEHVSIVTDEFCEDFGRAFFKACQIRGLDGVMITMPVSRTDGAEPSPTAAKAMENADVLVAVTKYTLTHGKATKRALKNGCRVLSIPNLSERIFLSKAMEGSPDMISTTKRISEILSGGLSARLTTKHGTDITGELGGWSRVGGADTGEIDTPGILANLPAGESLISPVEGTARGRAVIDASISGGIGKLTEKVVLQIDQGRVVSVEGGAEAEALRKVLESSDENSSNLAEFAFGINPYAEVIGNIIIDEKTVGTAHLGIGNSQMLGGKIYSNMHLDAVFFAPRVEVDGHLIMEDGNFITGPAPWETLDYHGYNAGVEGKFIQAGAYEIDEQGCLFKKWQDVMGRTFHTRVGNEEASQKCAKVIEALRAEGADAKAVAAACGFDQLQAARTIGMLKRYMLAEKVV